MVCTDPFSLLVLAFEDLFATASKSSKTWY